MECVSDILNKRKRKNIRKKKQRKIKNVQCNDKVCVSKVCFDSVSTCRRKICAANMVPSACKQQSFCYQFGKNIRLLLDLLKQHYGCI